MEKVEEEISAMFDDNESHPDHRKSDRFILKEEISD